jgi:hypothetical protein
MTNPLQDTHERTPTVMDHLDNGESVNLDSGLVGHWQFEEEAGDVVNDSSGNNNHGVLLNGKRGDGAFKGTIELSGGDDSHASIPSSDTLNTVESQITVAASVFPLTLRQGFTVVVSRQVENLLHPDQFYLGFGPENGVLHYKWHLGVENGEGDCYSGDPITGQWIHMVGTYDGQSMRLYVDGKEIGNRPLSGKIRVDDNPITIGGEENGPVPQDVENGFDGYIDDVRFYNRALNQGEVEALYELHSSNY